MCILIGLIKDCPQLGPIVFVGLVVHHVHILNVVKHMTHMSEPVSLLRLDFF